MIQKIIELQNEPVLIEHCRQESARKQRFDESAFDSSREKLLQCEMARLRLRFKLGKEAVKE